MYARVARWEGADAEAMRRSVEEIDAQAQSGPPEGVPAKAFLLLMAPDRGETMAISLFETADDLRRGDEALNAMSPPDDGMGRRSSVEVFEVGVDVRLGAPA
jgi:hypothetical protein